MTHNTAHSAQPKSAQEITMKIYVRQDDCDTHFLLGTNGKVLAKIEKCEYPCSQPWEVYTNGGNAFLASLKSYPDAVEKVTDYIEQHFAEYGINVEFVKE